MSIKDFFMLLPALLDYLPFHGYLVIFIFSFLEALAFVGVIFPGTAIIIILGVFAYLGYWNFALVFLLVFVGAVLGDVLSYFLGKKFGIPVERKLKHNRIYRYLGLDLAMEFLAENEIKGVIIGRLIGPSRAFVPFLLGSLNKKMRTFIASDILSVFLWCSLYLGLGAIFGSSIAFVSQVVDHVETLFIFFIALFVIVSFIARFTVKRPIHKPLKDKVRQ